MNTNTTTVEDNKSKTANGMLALKTTSNSCTDLFFQIGSMRKWTESQIISSFKLAFDENPLIAMKILFYNRDVIMGQGEKRTFRTIISELAESNTETLRKNLNHIPELGRWDDLLFLFDTVLEEDALNLIEKGLKDEVGLCGKWMPREKSRTYPKAWKKVANRIGANPKEYRAILKSLTAKANAVEQLMCAGEWDKIDYKKVSSIAMKNNKGAFYKHNEEGFENYIESLVKGETKINAQAIFPHDITKQLVSTSGWGDASLSEMTKAERTILEEQWKALPNYLEGSEGRMMIVSDVSGSMMSPNGIPMDVCIGLSLYVSEKNEGAFKDCVITFDDNPTFIKLEGKTLSDRAVELANIPWGGTTNLEGTFSALLNRAVSQNVLAEDMPDTILIMSDMQFDRAVRNGDDNAYEMIKREYDAAGYNVPRIVFWNLNATAGTNPVSFNKRGTALISGFSPSILRSIMSGSDDFTPYSMMMETIGEERYSLIKA